MLSLKEKNDLIVFLWVKSAAVNIWLFYIILYIIIYTVWWALNSEWIGKHMHCWKAATHRAATGTSWGCCWNDDYFQSAFVIWAPSQGIPTSVGVCFQVLVPKIRHSSCSGLTPVLNASRSTEQSVISIYKDWILKYVHIILNVKFASRKKKTAQCVYLCL